MDKRIWVYDLTFENEGTSQLQKVRDSGLLQNKKVNTPWGVVQVLNMVFEANRQSEENVYMVAFDAAGNIKGLFLIAHGTMTKSFLNIRGIFHRLLLCDAMAFIIAHNHPTGECQYKETDRRATEQMQKAASIMEMEMLDHIIIGSVLGEDKYYSCRENGELNQSERDKSYEYR